MCEVFTLEQARGKEGCCRCGARRELIRNGRLCVLRCISQHCKEPDEKVTITNFNGVKRFVEPQLV